MELKFLKINKDMKHSKKEGGDEGRQVGRKKGRRKEGKEEGLGKEGREGGKNRERGRKGRREVEKGSHCLEHGTIDEISVQRVVKELGNTDSNAARKSCEYEDSLTGKCNQVYLLKKFIFVSVFI